MSNANEPAYPAKLKRTDREFGTAEALFPGLTKREYFAAMAMQGLLSDSKNIALFDDLNYGARTAVKFADALLAELERTA